MKQDPTSIIIKILGIIGYRNDKLTFAREFVEICMQDSFKEMLERLPKEKVSELETKIKGAENLAEFAEILKRYISPPILERTIERNTARLFEEYIDDILPTIDDKTKEQLMEYLDEVGRTVSPAA